MNTVPLDVLPEVADALAGGQPVVALESTLIAHGLPWPTNLATARQAEDAIRSEGAIPATIAVWHGRLRVGLNPSELAELAQAHDVAKASRRDLANVLTAGGHAATTVAGTIFVAHLAGIRFFATGGIGGVHRDAASSFDVSADLHEVSRTPACVTCAGVKSILDVPATLEVLETLGVPVVGYQTGTFPAFYVASSGLPVEVRRDTPEAVATLARMHWQLGGHGLVIAVPPPQELALTPSEFEEARAKAEREGVALGIKGKAVTPFLLARLAEHTSGRSVEVNRALITSNARVAARIAVKWMGG